MYQNIASLVNDKVIEGISDMHELSDREGIRIVIDLKKDANPNVVLNLLYKHTELQSTQSMLMLALVNNEPKILPLREILYHYINHRKEVITRRTLFDLKKAQARLHILEGLKIALDHIDEIVKLIKSAKDDNQAKTNLMERFGLSEIQAQSILDMKLRSLTGLSRDKIEEEYKALVETIAKLNAILNDEQLVLNIIKEDLLEMKKNYGDERKTKIGHGESDINVENLIK
jgi:DNA gyrase subunit A